jgi:hypothetical protein
MRLLQVLHIAHDLHSVSKNEAVSDATAPTTAYKYLCAHARFILTQILARREAERNDNGGLSAELRILPLFHDDG